MTGGLDRGSKTNKCRLNRIDRSTHPRPDNLFKAVQHMNVKNSKKAGVNDANEDRSFSNASSETGKLKLSKLENSTPNKKRVAVQDGVDGGDETEKKCVNVSPLTAQKCVADMAVWGCVAGVRDLDMKVDLPNGIAASVSVLNVCDAYSRRLKEVLRHSRTDVTPLSDLYSKGDLVRCHVLRSDDADGPLKLSLNPRHVNRNLSSACLVKGFVVAGSVSSVEDHGYAVDLGVGDIAAFLPRENATQYRHSPLVVGTPVLCCVVGKTGRTVTVSIDPSCLNTVEKGAQSIFTLQPGMNIKAVVSKVGRGVIARYLKHRGTIHVDHMLQPYAYTPGSAVTTRVLYVDYANKKIGLTHSPHLSGDPSRANISAMRGLQANNTELWVRLVSRDRDRFRLVTTTGVKAICLFSDLEPDDNLDRIQCQFSNNRMKRCQVMSVNFIDDSIRVKIIKLKPSPPTFNHTSKEIVKADVPKADVQNTCTQLHTEEKPAERKKKKVPTATLR